ncbi:MAG: hypothetical protein ACYC2Y_10580 [Armatimonadota bacterium]
MDYIPMNAAADQAIRTDLAMMCFVFAAIFGTLWGLIRLWRASRRGAKSEELPKPRRAHRAKILDRRPQAIDFGTLRDRGRAGRVCVVSPGGSLQTLRVRRASAVGLPRGPRSAVHGLRLDSELVRRALTEELIEEVCGGGVPDLRRYLLRCPPRERRMLRLSYIAIMRFEQATGG